MRNITQRHTHAAPHGLLNDTRPQASLASEYIRDTPSAPSTSTDTSHAETETKDKPEHNADGNINMNRISHHALQTVAPVPPLPATAIDTCISTLP